MLVSSQFWIFIQLYFSSHIRITLNDTFNHIKNQYLPDASIQIRMSVIPECPSDIKSIKTTVR